MGRYSNQDTILRRLEALLARPLLSGDLQSAVVGRKVKQRQRRLRVGEIDDLVAAYGAGMRIRNLANRFGIHEATVHEHLNRRGVDRRPSPGLTPDQLSQAAIHYASGESCGPWPTGLGLIPRPSERGYETPALRSGRGGGGRAGISEFNFRACTSTPQRRPCRSATGAMLSAELAQPSRRCSATRRTGGSAGRRVCRQQS